MNSQLEIIDSIFKQSAILRYIAEKEDTSGLSELLTDIGKELDLCAINLGKHNEAKRDER